MTDKLTDRPTDDQSKDNRTDKLTDRLMDGSDKNDQNDLLHRDYQTQKDKKKTLLPRAHQIILLSFFSVLLFPFLSLVLPS